MYYKLYELIDLIKNNFIKKDILIALAVGFFGAAIFIVLVISLPNMFLN